MKKYFTLLLPVGYCSLQRSNISVLIPHSRNGTSIRSELVAWFGLCFSKYFTPSNVLGWINLLGYRSLAVPD